MTRKLAGAVALSAAIGILTATAVPALGHGRGPGESDVSLACPMAGEGMGAMMRMMMGPDSMGSMMGPDDSGSMMGPDAMGSMMGPDDSGSMMGPDDSGSMGPDDSGSMMGPDDSGSMGPDARDGASGPVEEDSAVDPVDHAAHHPAATPEPTE